MISFIFNFKTLKINNLKKCLNLQIFLLWLFSYTGFYLIIKNLIYLFQILITFLLI